MAFIARLSFQQWNSLDSLNLTEEVVPKYSSALESLWGTPLPATTIK